MYMVKKKKRKKKKVKERKKLNKTKTSNGKKGTMKVNFLPIAECQMCPL